MLKRSITYEDFDGEMVTEEFMFHLSKPELIELDVEHKEGLGMMLDKIIKAKNHKELLEQFKKIILLSYGEKSQDGKHFVKNDELREAFSHHAAYPVLFMELATDDDIAADFLKGVLPKDLVGDIDIKAKMKEATQSGAITKPPVPPTKTD